MTKKQLNSTITFRVYVEDTDFMNIVYHANHLKYFERARTETFREVGIHLTEMDKLGTYFAVHQINIKYHSPAKLDDLLHISTTVEQGGQCYLLFTQTMHNQHKIMLSEASVKVVCLSEVLKLKRIPKILENIVTMNIGGNSPGTSS